MIKIVTGQQDPKFDSLLGKIITFTDEEGKTQQGKLVFCGVNKNLHGKYQVSISAGGRATPFWPVDPNTIKTK